MQRTIGFWHVAMTMSIELLILKFSLKIFFESNIKTSTSNKGGQPIQLCLNLIRIPSFTFPWISRLISIVRAILSTLFFFGNLNYIWLPSLYSSSNHHKFPRKQKATSMPNCPCLWYYKLFLARQLKRRHPISHSEIFVDLGGVWLWPMKVLWRWMSGWSNKKFFGSFFCLYMETIIWESCTSWSKMVAFNFCCQIDGLPIWFLLLYFF